MVPQPISFQTLQIIYVNIHHPLSLRNGIRFSPIPARILLIVPLCCWNILLAMPTTTTHDTKCGRYRTDCVTFLNFTLKTSFSISETIMVSGKLTARVAKFKIKVFRIACQKFLLEKIFSKTLKPRTFQYSLKNVVILKRNGNTIHRNIFEHNVIQHNRNKHQVDPFIIPHLVPCTAEISRCFVLFITILFLHNQPPVLKTYFSSTHSS